MGGVGYRRPLITPVSLHGRHVEDEIRPFDSLSWSRGTLDAACPSVWITVSADLFTRRIHLMTSVMRDDSQKENVASIFRAQYFIQI